MSTVERFDWVARDVIAGVIAKASIEGRPLDDDEVAVVGFLENEQALLDSLHDTVDITTRDNINDCLVDMRAALPEAFVAAQSLRRAAVHDRQLLSK